MGFGSVLKTPDLGKMIAVQRVSRLKLLRNLLLALLALEMGKNKVLVKGERSDHISLNSLLTSKLPQREDFLRPNLLRCALLGNARSRQDCEQQLLYFLNEISQDNHPLAATPTNTDKPGLPQRPWSLRGLTPVEYLNLIQNCISKCDGWGSRVDYRHCMKSCQRENSLLQHLDQSHQAGGSDCTEAPCETGRGDNSRREASSDCPYGNCGQEGWLEMKTSKGRKEGKEEACPGPWCGLDQLRKRRWGDTLTTCIASYCNSLNGVNRVDCIINKCDKQRRG